MYKVELEVDSLEDVHELFDLADKNENIDIITQKNFNGDVTTIELYISLAVNVIAVVVPVINALISQRRVSSLKIDGDKIEVENVTQDLIEKILNENLAKKSNAKQES